MTRTAPGAAAAVTAEFEQAWRDDVPVFACCRRAVAAAVEHVDLPAVAVLGATERVAALRAAVDAELPGHLATHRCCSGHVTNLAFDLPDLIAPVAERV